MSGRSCTAADATSSSARFADNGVRLADGENEGLAAGTGKGLSFHVLQGKLPGRSSRTSPVQGSCTALALQRAVNSTAMGPIYY